MLEIFIETISVISEDEILQEVKSNSRGKGLGRQTQVGPKCSERK